MAVQDADRAVVARLLRRAGFGATGVEIDAASSVGISDYLATALAADPAADPGVVATPAPQVPLVARPKGKDPSPADKQAYREAVRDGLRDITAWWFRRMVAVRQPLTERLTLGWHNHFATSRTKVKQGALLLRQNETIRVNALGDFSQLALAMLTDPAMLVWLDGRDNVAGSPNENLSREFLELFTLGHGNGYTEGDVREGARALTGWRLADDGTARLDAERHDAGTKTVLGVTGNLDETAFCLAVLAQPAVASHVTTRLYAQLVSDEPPPPDLVESAAGPFAVDWNIAALVGRLLSDDRVVGRSGTRVIGPIEWTVGAVRALRLPTTEATAVTKLVALLTRLGQVPFAPPSVAGWPPGTAWLSTAAHQLRLEAGPALARAGDLGLVTAAANSERVDATGQLLGIPAWSQRTRAGLQGLAGDPPALVGMALNSPEYLTI